MQWPKPVISECRAHFEMQVLTVTSICYEDCDWPEVQNAGSDHACAWGSLKEAIWLDCARAKT